MAVIKAISSGASLKRAIKYITNPEKTAPELMAAIGCSADPEQALAAMEVVKLAWMKFDGRQYKHITMSYPADEEITPEKALQNAVQLIENTKAFEGYQALFAVHTNTDHLHVHVILNSVNAENGLKVQFSKADLQDLKDRCNELHRQQGLSVPVKGNEITAYNKNKYAVMDKALQGKYKSYLLDCYNAVAAARSNAVSREDFIERMGEAGWETTWADSRKHITFADHEGNKVRAANLEKTFKVPVSKEVLENEFTSNAERAAEQTGRSADGREFEENALTERIRAIEGVGESRGVAQQVRERSEENGETGSEDLGAFLRDLDAKERAAEEKRKDRENERKRLDHEAERRAAEKKQRTADREYRTPKRKNRSGHGDPER